MPPGLGAGAEAEVGGGLGTVAGRMPPGGDVRMRRCQGPGAGDPLAGAERTVGCHASSGCGPGAADRGLRLVVRDLGDQNGVAGSVRRASGAGPRREQAAAQSCR